MHKFLIPLLLGAACTASPTPPPAPAAPQAVTAARRRPGAVPIPSRGLSCQTAIAIEGVTEADQQAQESRWIEENYPGATGLTYGRVTCEGKTIDEVKFVTANGRNSTLYFDAAHR